MNAKIPAHITRNKNKFWANIQEGLNSGFVVIEELTEPTVKAVRSLPEIKKAFFLDQFTFAIRNRGEEYCMWSFVSGRAMPELIGEDVYEWVYIGCGRAPKESEAYQAYLKNKASILRKQEKEQIAAYRKRFERRGITLTDADARELVKNPSKLLELN